MKMPDDLAATYNDQITMELGSSVAYLQMSAHFESANLIGMASWMRQQAEEEREHAQKFMDFVLNRGNDVEIGAIKAPKSRFSNTEEVFEAALAQEQAVSKSIHDIYRLATDKGDLASFPLLQWFIDEQNEEEATVDTILERIRMAGGDSSAILLIDAELGSRGSGE